ncbi:MULTISPECIES: CD225/dispanin family protein [Prauserella salsuginis group]|uniref:CD225/dispanin family protein n=1 Tax=Prauserella salsuginis TaxID=387889 RepID=A0ABW6G3N0_9PSEU|nr:MULTISPECIES: CD225/dispanin family protein [Prauserella salsuginis group]MCR3718696.1 Interferon-induced transmembrane protein [Prauserella flava]MCR3733266.1 Interferon-induced transmembrane protein [Prauserella salsuginis]
MTGQHPPYPDGYSQQPQYPQQGYPPGYGQPPGYGYGYPPPPPENHLVWGILTTIMCCMPLGIVSIVKANQVSTLWAQGLYAEAKESADQAKKWAMWSAITVGIFFALYILFIVVALLIVGLSLEEITPT